MKDKALFELMASLFNNDLGIPAQTEEINGEQALVIEYNNEIEKLPYDCTVTVSHPAHGFTAVQLFFPLFSRLDAATARDAASLLPEMNALLNVGSFGIMEDDGFVYFSYAFLTDGLEEANCRITLAAAFSLLTLTASRGRAILLPLIEKTATKEELLQSGDLNIIQD